MLCICILHLLLFKLQYFIVIIILNFSVKVVQHSSGGFSLLVAPPPSFVRPFVVCAF